MENAFAKHVGKGLSLSPKRLSSKYFYDDEGSRIFQEIMHMPSYYLTDVEWEICRTRPLDIHLATGYQDPYRIIELGAGDGLKTTSFLNELLKASVKVTYYPVDISQEAMNALVSNMSRALPKLEIVPLVSDYFQINKVLNSNEVPALYLFMGSNIGNFEAEQALNFIQHVYDQMHPGDHFLIGVDLRKNPHTILEAYNDPEGITKRFNLNLLGRINRELGGEFVLDQFDFYPTYYPLTGEVRSFLVSLQEQEVWIDALGRSFHFGQDEIISTELSKKYQKDELEDLLSKGGFTIVDHFQDHKKWFTATLCKK